MQSIVQKIIDSPMISQLGKICDSKSKKGEQSQSQTFHQWAVIYDEVSLYLKCKVEKGNTH